MNKKIKINSKTFDLQQKILNIIKYYDTLKSEAMDNTEFDTLQSREAIELSELLSKEDSL